MLSFEITKGSPNFILLSQICLGFFWGFLHFCENCEIVIVCIKKKYAHRDYGESFGGVFLVEILKNLVMTMLKISYT